MTGILPGLHGGLMNDPRMKKLLDYARVRERQMYQTAESRVRITVILT